jgi:uncharacterized membrane protein
MGQDNNDNSYGDYGGYGGSSQQQSNNPSSYSDQSSGQSGQQGSNQQQSYGQQYQQQTYSSATYAPPASAQGSSAYDPTSTGLQAKTAALISYLFGWVSGIVFLLIERKNRFVRFSAAQSTIFFGAVTILLVLLHYIGAFLGGIFLIGFLLGWVFSCASFVIGVPAFLIWLFLMIRAYQGKAVRLPFISGYADSLVNRLTPRSKRTI